MTPLFFPPPLLCGRAPECAPLKSKMIYASSKDAIKKKLTGELEGVGGGAGSLGVGGRAGWSKGTGSLDTWVLCGGCACLGPLGEEWGLRGVGREGWGVRAGALAAQMPGSFPPRSNRGVVPGSMRSLDTWAPSLPRFPPHLLRRHQARAAGQLLRGGEGPVHAGREVGGQLCRQLGGEACVSPHALPHHQSGPSRWGEGLLLLCPTPSLSLQGRGLCQTPQVPPLPPICPRWGFLPATLVSRDQPSALSTSHSSPPPKLVNPAVLPILAPFQPLFPP